MKIFTNILASFFSILLVIALLAAPLSTFATSFFEKSTINEFIESLNLKEELLEGITINGKTNEQFVNKIKNSKFYNKLFELCSDYISAPLFDSDINISEKNITDLADKYIDELSSIITETIPDFAIPSDTSIDNFSITDGEIKDKVRSAIAEVAPTIVKELKEIRDNSKISEIADAIKMIKNIHTAIIIAIVALSIIVFACTFRKLNGFIWLGVDYAIAALLTFFLSGILKNILDKIFSEIKLAEYLNSIRNFITNKAEEIFNDKIILYIIIAAICLVIAIVYKVYHATRKGHHKKETKTENAVPQINCTNANPHYAPNSQNNYQNNYQNTQFTEPAPEQKPEQKDSTPYVPELPNNSI